MSDQPTLFDMREDTSRRALGARLYEHAEGLARRDAPDTSRDAARRIAPASGSQRMRVLVAIAGAGEMGATEEEITAQTGISPNSVRPRRRELEAGGYVEPTTLRRPTLAGRDAIVYRATSLGRAILLREDGAV